MSVAVRRATPSDAVAIGEVHAASWRVAYVDQFAPADLAAAADARAARWTDDLVAEKSSNGGSMLVAESDGIVCGFGYAVPGEVVGLYVDPLSWGSGAGAAILSALVAALPPETLQLWTFASSGRARRFYEKNGWVLTGRSRECELVPGAVRQVVEYAHPPR